MVVGVCFCFYVYILVVWCYGFVGVFYVHIIPFRIMDGCGNNISQRKRITEMLSHLSLWFLYNMWIAILHIDSRS